MLLQLLQHVAYRHGHIHINVNKTIKLRGGWRNSTVYRKLLALSEDPDLVANTQGRWLTGCDFSSRTSKTAPAQTWYTETHMAHVYA